MLPLFQLLNISMDSMAQVLKDMTKDSMAKVPKDKAELLQMWDTGLVQPLGSVLIFFLFKF